MQFASVSRTALRRYAVGDAAAILLFVIVGELQHGNPVARAAVAVLPFAAAWALAAYGLGVYASDTETSLRANLGRVAAAWALADVLAQVIRVAVGEAAPGGALVLFAAVTYLFGVLFLGVWRVAALAIAAYRD
ncbi:DUF3054 domain-containing protein [Halocalculus aciditolerans]|uniref:DUF3054 domain-containing protein n=1 Tax=Halocalculus aciditolerans TaxID=1383812 RepID=A0A830F2L7_9EURY|nr:DUF3054 domain-containing protein [Halocalculus aciditolerans]GGL56512.1 hypothetical protein GCM10009039_13290 [Halocalculus aciditolerans]